MTQEALSIAHAMDAVAIKPKHGFEDMKKLVEVSKKYDLHLIYGMNCYYPYLLKELKDSNTIVGGGIGSSGNGCEPTEVKLFQARMYQEMGCKEVDMYINIPYIRDGMAEEALKELKLARDAIKCTMKVIIEAPCLSDSEIKTASEVVVESGADYLKTGTGFLGPTTLDTVRKVKDIVGEKIMIKAAGGIEGVETIRAMKTMGVSRFGMGYEKVIDMMEKLG